MSEAEQVSVLPSPSFDTSKWTMPNFEAPKIEVPAAFREIAEKSLAQAKQQYEKMKAAAEEATGVLEDTYTTGSKGCTDYGLKLIETARANTDATFDLMTELMSAKSCSEVIELYTGFVRKQFDAFTTQAKDLMETAQKVASETTEPMKAGFASAFKKVA